MEVQDIYRIYLRSKRISTDSRNVETGDLFFALKGEHFDGNAFARQALSNGAARAVIDNPEYHRKDDPRYLLVNDALLTLQDLAVIHRSNLKCKALAITGSNGKTTTKELVARVLSAKFRTQATAGNLNNHIGVPLTLLSIEPETEFAVVEMGANHMGEIARLCEIAQPGYGVITNIGKAHLEGFGNIEGVARAKGELYDYIRSTGGLVFLNADNERLSSMAKGIQSVAYSTVKESFCKGQLLESHPTLKIGYLSEGIRDMINTQITGAFNMENILCAVAAGLYFGVEPHEIKSAVEGYVPRNNRSQILKTEHNTVLLDAYNANPTSMKAALDHFRQSSGDKKAVILGDMLELGGISETEHQRMIEYVRDLGFDRILLAGSHFTEAYTGDGGEIFATVEELIAHLQRAPLKGYSVLVKGSRKIGLEKVIPHL